jgi:hypothetical protein
VKLRRDRRRGFIIGFIAFSFDSGRRGKMLQLGRFAIAIEPRARLGSADRPHWPL